LQGQTAGISRERLAAQVARDVSAPVLDEAIARLVAAGTLRQDGGLIRVPRPAQEREQASQETQLADRLAETIRKGALTPPDMPSDIPTRRMLDRLIRAGILVRTFDKVQKREVLFHHEAVETARRRLIPLMNDGHGLLVGEAGAALGISRKYSVPLLEYLDQIQFTRRVGDRRLLTASAQN
jgi:selenocysteine-specific elongation factor